MTMTAGKLAGIHANHDGRIYMGIFMHGHGVHNGKGVMRLCIAGAS